MIAPHKDFVNMIFRSGTVHRVSCNDALSACGLPLIAAKQIAANVTCKRCKDTNTFRRGGH